MGIGGISIWQLLIVLVIVLLLFGTKRLRGLGGDLGGAIKGFKKALKEDTPEEDTKTDADAQAKVQADAEERTSATDSHKPKSETKQ